MYSLTFHEKKLHGTIDFPVEYHYVDSSHDNYHMPLHWHREWELIRILKGSFTFHADEEDIVAYEGDLLLIHDSMLHGGTPLDCIYECLVFDLHNLFRSSELIKKHFRPVYRMHLLPYNLYSEAKNPKIYALTDELMESASRYNPDSPDYNELIIISCICRLFAQILKDKLYISNPDSNPNSSHKIGQIKSVLEFIEAQYQNTITLNDLARVAGMNPKYFCRIFKEITHQTPVDYVIFYRIEQAAMLLSTTNHPIIDIAMECGFNDCSYFIRTFKKLKKMTPNQYRKR